MERCPRSTRTFRVLGAGRLPVLLAAAGLLMASAAGSPAGAEPLPPPPPLPPEGGPPGAPLQQGLAAAGSQAGLYRFDDPHQNVVSFQVRAPLFPPLPPLPLRKIRGVSNAVEGAVRVAGGHASGEFRIPVDSFKTGSARRDRRMAGKRVLDADRHPFVRFRFDGLRLPPVRYAGEPFEVTVEGTFTLHGVTRTARVPVQVTYLPEAGSSGASSGALLRLRARLRVNLADHLVRRPGFLLWRVARSAQMELDLQGQKVEEVTPALRVTAPAPALRVTAPVTEAGKKI